MYAAISLILARAVPCLFLFTRAYIVRALSIFAVFKIVFLRYRLVAVGRARAPLLPLQLAYSHGRAAAVIAAYCHGNGCDFAVYEAYRRGKPL